MSKRLTILICLLVIVAGGSFWLLRRNAGDADVTTSDARSGTRQASEPNITMSGKVKLDSGQPNNITVLVRGRGARVKSDGSYVVVVSKSDFVDDFGSVISALPVQFIDLVNNQRYQTKNLEPTTVELPPDLYPSNIAVYLKADSTNFYTTNYLIHRDFELVSTAF